MRSVTSFKKGLTLAEVVVASAIILILVVALFSAYTAYLKVAFSGINTVKAAFLAEEGIEAVKLLRDQSWTKNIAPLTAGANYYFAYNTGMSFWSTTTPNTFIDSLFERKFVLSAVNRDPTTQDISPGGTDDPNTKLVTVSVSWSERGATSSKSVATYVTNIIGN